MTKTKDIGKTVIDFFVCKTFIA